MLSNMDATVSIPLHNSSYDYFSFKFKSSDSLGARHYLMTLGNFVDFDDFDDFDD